MKFRAGRVKQFFVTHILRAKWIVTAEDEGPGELGIRVLGINLWYYKWTDPMLANYAWRRARKREFGDVVKSIRDE